MSVKNQFDIEETDKSITIIFSSTMENIDRTCMETIRFLKALFPELHSGHSGSLFFATQLVMREGLTNAVRHGNRLNPDKIVKYILELSDNNTLNMEIEDEGDGFDWKEAQQKNENMDDSAEHRRGMLIMEQYFSSFSYNEKGNKLVLMKKIQVDTDKL